MSTRRVDLKTSLVARYTHLRERLTARLGSEDLAGEALHETWLKLNEIKDDAPVADANAYIFRAAVNMASTLSTRNRRALGDQEIEDILRVADDTPDPERTAIAKSELAHVWKILSDLTKRQRHIFIESFTGTMSHNELADHYGVSVRMIQIDLRTAILHCVRRSKRKNPFAGRASRVSIK
ncbi:MAG: RNA polymerase sigma factor [Parasphingorhabdus sp.]